MIDTILLQCTFSWLNNDVNPYNYAVEAHGGHMCLLPVT